MFELSELGIKPAAQTLVEQAEREIRSQADTLYRLSLRNQAKVLSAFREQGVEARHFSPSTGYGYDDIGRDTLDALYARIFGAERALVRPQLVSATHALAVCLYGILRPGDTMLSITGSPYDTLEKTIGISGDPGKGSLKDFGILYEQVDLLSDGSIDLPKVLRVLTSNRSIRLVFLQRSRGYHWRRALSMDEMASAIRRIKELGRNIVVMVDNCYGEFCQDIEPTEAGADIACGSLIKNPGGGLAPTGAYIVGKADAVDLVACRLTTPGIGGEVGSYAAGYLPFYQGLFMAPHVVNQSMRGSILAARVFELMGYEVLPASDEVRNDIIQSIRFKDKESLVAFIQSIQAASPVDSMAIPEPWPMPGYQHDVIMAAGTFVQGSSIELSADAPIKSPYTAYLQGGLTYEHDKLAMMMAVSRLLV